MTETPKCPYCGAELELKYVCGEYFCLCAGCEATSPMGTSKEAAISAALHRAEPEMRTLTLAEVKAHCAKWSDAEPLYIEFSRRTTLSRWILVAPNIECNEPATVTRYLDIWEHDYGKTWRCWPRKPTPEQKAAAKWEE